MVKARKQHSRALIIMRKNRGFRTLNVIVLRASLIRVENMIDEMSDGCYNMDNQTTL